MSEPNSGGTPPVPPVPQLPPVPQYGEYAQPGSVPQPYAQPYAQPGAPSVQPGATAAAYGYGVAPTAPPRRTWDLVLTIILLVLGLVGMFVGIGYGLIFMDPSALDRVFQQQGLGDYNGTVGAAPAVIIASHLILYLIAAGLSIVLLIRRKVTFWVPLTAGVIAAIIFWAMLAVVFTSDPDFMSKYS